MRHYLFITIDTEEDLWGGYAVKHPPVVNMQKINLLQEIFEKNKAVPTYLINYPVATDAYSIEVLNDLLRQKKCDLGSHCHPWNTPPFHDDGDMEYNSFMCNLSSELVLKKMIQLHNIIKKNFQFAPIVFRAGRWGIGENVIKAIKELGYKIDSSITPFISWEDSYGPKMYMKTNATIGLEGLDKLCNKAENTIRWKSNSIVEIPPTIGFLQNNFKLCHRVRTFFMNRFSKRLHFIGILDRLRLLNFRMLSPETSSFEDMVKLSKAMMSNGHRFLNMSFHSTSLLAGCSPFVKNEEELKIFLTKIDRYLKLMAKENVTCIGMSRAIEVLA